MIVACKGSDVEPLTERLDGHFAGATVMTVQNGLGAEEIAGAHGSWPLLSAVTFMSGTRISDTAVEYVLDTETWIGPYRDTTPADARAVAALIASSGLKAQGFDDLRPAQWSKLIFNATVNAVAALTGLAHDPHFAQTEQLSDLGNLVRDLVDEGKAVAAAAGRRALGRPVGDERARNAARPQALSVDARGRQGAPADRGRARSPARSFARRASVGVPVPLHTALYALVKAKEASYS